MSLAKSRMLSDATRKHILLRGFPTGTTAQDVRRLLARAEVRGVSEVAMYYKHFRPTGKAIVTMALPDYTSAALRAAESISFPGCKIGSESISDPSSFLMDGEDRQQLSNDLTGDGPFAGVPERTAVTIVGFMGKVQPSQVLSLLDGFRTAKDRRHPMLKAKLPDKKFSLFSRYTVFLESESEAQRFVRKYHMTYFKNIPSGPQLKAFVIY